MPNQSPSLPSITYVEGVEKVTGKAKYTFDLTLPGMLVGKFLYAEYPRARITRLDTSAAEAMTGVEAVVTHDDIPGEKIYGYITKDQPFFAIDEVSYIGDIVAAVAAIDEDTAEAALQAIEVEYEPLPGVFDPLEAMKPDAPLARGDLDSNVISHTQIDVGDVDKAFAEADLIVEHTYNTAFMDQLFLETEGTVATWDGVTLTVYTSGQSPHRDRIQIAEAMNLPANKVRVIYPYVGGGFGGKDELHTQTQVAVLAWKAGRPVKLVRSRGESLFTHVKRASFDTRYKTAAKADGTITAIDVEVVVDAGPYTNASLAVAGFAAEHASGSYKVENARINAYAVATNNLAGGAMRGFGGPEMAFAQEQNLDIVAEELGIDPIDIRLKNGMEKDTLMPTGAYVYNDIGLKETIEKAAEVTNWFERDEWLEREPAPHLRRGLGVATVLHGIGISPYLMDFADATVEMMPDGSAVLLSSTAEYGSGARTAQAIILANELGIRAEDVTVSLPDTHFTPDAGPTVASRSTYMVGNAILKAVKPIQQSLLEVASEELEVSQYDLLLSDGMVTVKGAPAGPSMSIKDAARIAWDSNKPLRGDGHAVMWEPPEHKAELTYPASHSIYSYTTQIAQVLVDVETGNITVERIWSAHDVGKVINRLGLEGQVDGGVLQGVGTAIMEELQIEEGRLISSSLESYLVPSVMDFPQVEPIIIEVPEPSGPYGAKGMAEAPLAPTAAAIANAVSNAIGVRTWAIPMTPERILKALDEREAAEG